MVLYQPWKKQEKSYSIFFFHRMPVEKYNSSAELLRHEPLEISRKVQVFKEDSSFKLKLKCLPTMCEFWKLFTLQLHSCSLLTSSSFIIHMYTLVFSNKFKEIPKQISDIFSLCSLHLLATLLHKFQMPQASWTTVLSTLLSDTTVLCSRPPLSL